MMIAYNEARKLIAQYCNLYLLEHGREGPPKNRII